MRVRRWLALAALARVAGGHDFGRDLCSARDHRAADDGEQWRSARCERCTRLAEEHARRLALGADAAYQAMSACVLRRVLAAFDSRHDGGGVLVSMTEESGEWLPVNSRGHAARAASLLRWDVPVCPAR